MRKRETSYKKYICVNCFFLSLFVKLILSLSLYFPQHASNSRFSFLLIRLSRCSCYCYIYCYHAQRLRTLQHSSWYSWGFCSPHSSSSCINSLYIRSYTVFLSSWATCLIQTGNEWDNGKPVTKYSFIIHVFLLAYCLQPLFYTPCFIWSWFIPKHWFYWGLRFSFFIYSPITFYTSLHMIHRLTPEVPFHV